MLMTQAGARQDHRRQRGIGDMNRKAGRQQRGCARRQLYGVVETGSQVKSGGAGGGIGRQRKLLADTRVQNLNVDFFIITGHDLVE